MKKLKTFDSSYFRGKSHFEEDGTQNCLVFQPIHRYFKVIANTQYILEWKFKGLSHESITPPSISENSLSPIIAYFGTKIRLKFSGGCLKQPKLTYTHRKTVNIYIVYELGASGSLSNDTTLKNALFGVVKLTKNADIDKCQYSGYGSGFDRKGSVSFLSIGLGQNVIIFGVDMSSSVHINNKGKDILILGILALQWSK